MALSYEFSIGSVRTKEKNLFTNGDIEHMLACESEGGLCRYLSDKGYGDGSDIEEILKSHSQSVWDYIRRTAPDFAVFTPFLYLNDVHNIKAVLKGTLSGRGYAHLITEPSVFSADTLTTAVENRKFSLLGEDLSAPADKAYEVLAHTGDARLSDAILDKAFMELIIKTAEKSGSEFMVQYFKTTVFYNNVKIAIRGAKADCDRDFFENAICGVQDFPRTKVIDASVKGVEPLLDVLSKISAYGCSKAAEEYKHSPSAFERFADNTLMSLTKEKCKVSGDGADPITGYLIANETEKKVIHIIASGIRTKTDYQTIKERLREVYG